MLYGWKENAMLTNCIAACANLSITISEIQRDICEKNRHFIPHLHSTPPLGGFPSEYRHPLWDGKTTTVLLSDGEKISKISLFILTWSTNVTDRQTLRDSKDRTCIASRGKKNFEDMYNHLDSILACDRRTDRQKDINGIIRTMHTRRAVKMLITWLTVVGKWPN